MPHLVILYTSNLDHESGMTALCRSLADGMPQQRDENNKQIFPAGGAGGRGDCAFVYLNLCLGRGRSPAGHKAHRERPT